MSQPGTTELAELARSQWWQGDLQQSMALSEQLFARLEREGKQQEAARTALTLALQWGTRGDIAVSSAWLGRARRLLDALPESVEHGYLLYVEGNDAMNLDGDPGPALAGSVRLRELAARLDAPELASFAGVLSGLGAIRTGDAATGFRELDEAMLPVMAGQVPAEWGGDIYCSVIHLCHETADYARMRAWTDALARWCAELSRTFMFSAIVRVHQLQLLSAEGAWESVEQDMAALGERLRYAHAWIAGDAYYELGEDRRRHGDLEGAGQAFGFARALGGDAEPGSALLLADSGRSGEAIAALRAAMAERGTLGRVRLLLPAVELLAGRSPAAAAVYCDELEAAAAFYGTAGFKAWARHARGIVLAAEGHPATAAEEFEAAAALYRAQRLRYELAAVHERLAGVRAALGDLRAADAEHATAAAIRARLGTGAAGTGDRSKAPAPGGLTPRELEVIGCVLAGASNRRIAEALSISEKTVGRHLANIFTKINVESRTAAAAWARKHGVPEFHAG
ncbi:helix-turn-helix domain-containing protein [Arthrobacter silvisoli]|uniref:helix-turn-helix domain-containing protein n=1 Tax=Arthrobacter silvisoli TaxID=2291022 RepID=UPI000E2178FF|nr:helix-turn-helix transcriptional regulator [Arthrobacter silvisoli]